MRTFLLALVLVLAMSANGHQDDDHDDDDHDHTNHTDTVQHAVEEALFAEVDEDDDEMLELSEIRNCVNRVNIDADPAHVTRTEFIDGIKNEMLAGKGPGQGNTQTEWDRAVNDVANALFTIGAGTKQKVPHRKLGNRIYLKIDNPAAGFPLSVLCDNLDRIIHGTVHT